MDRAGDEFLAGTGFAADEHRGVALRDLADHAQHALQRIAGADDPFEVVGLLLLVAEVVELMAQPFQLERLVDLDLHLLDLERLLHVVEGAVLHRLDRGVDRSERGHQDERRGRMESLGRAQHLEPGRAAHLQVADDDVEVALVKLLDRGVAVAGLLDIVAGRRQRQREPAPECIMIVRDQYSPHISP